MNRASLLQDKYLWSVLGLSAAMLVLVALEPFGADNAVLHSMALDCVRQGKVPYIGSWDNNFPGIVYIHALSILLFGTADVAFRLLDIIIELAFAAFLYRFLLRWFKPHAAALSAVLYIAFYVSGGPDVYGKQDIYGMMLVMVGASFVVGDGRGWMSLVLAGIVAGASLLMRPTFLLFVGLMALFVVGQGGRGGLFGRGLIRAVVFVLASLLPIGVVVLYYHSIPGGLTAVYNSTIRFNLDVYAGLGTTSKLWWEVGRSGFMIVMAVAALIRWGKNRDYLIRRPDMMEKLLYVASLAGMFAIVLIMGKYYRYHLAPFFLLLTPLAAAGIERTIVLFHSEVRRHVAMLACIFLCTFIGYNPMSQLAFGLGLMARTNPFERADEARRPDTLFGAKTELALREYLSTRENRNGAVEICSFSPFLRYHLHRTSAGPYITFHALAFRTDASRVGAPHYTPYQLQWQRAYVDSLRSVKPHFIVMARGMPFWYIQDVYSDCLRYVPGFDSLMAADYRYDTVFGGFQVYRRVIN